MNGWTRDLGRAARRLKMAGGFSVAVILMLTIGIGAATTIFSLIEGILLRPLPFRDPGRLVQLGEHVGENPGIGITPRDIRSYSAAASAFSSMGAFGGADFEVSGGATPEDLTGARLTASIFPTLGVQPIVGRVFTQQEDDSHAQVAVLSYSLWTERFHRDPHVVGTVIDLDRKAYTILGVMPRDFEFPLIVGRVDQAQLWVPMSLTPDELSDEEAGFWGFTMVARLKDGVTLSQAAQDADRVAQQIMRGFPPTMSGIRIHGDAKLLSEVVTGDTGPLLRMLLVAVLVVLLIACVNVAILMLVRAVRNHREYAVRLALGARSVVLTREIILEGLILSSAGGVLGLALAAVAVRTALHIAAESIPRLDAISINVPVALFALGIALLTGVFCSVAPAFIALRTNLAASLKDNMRGATGSAAHGRLRSLLVIGEIGVALVLLVASLAFLRSYQKMLAIDPGFQPEHVLVAGYRLPENQYPTDASIYGFDRNLIDRLSNQAGIVAAALGDSLPSAGNSGMSAYTIEGQSAEGWKVKFAGFASTYGDYFQALGIPLLAGRTFTPNDRADAPPVVMVSQSMAQHSWPGENPIGKRMHAGNPKKNRRWATVVGVVGNTRIGARDAKANDQWYIPAMQPEILFGPVAQDREAPSGGSILLRSALPPEQMIGTLRSTVAEIDPQLALDDVRTMHDVLSNTEAPRRIMTELVSVFAAIGLALALSGIYAVVSFSVTLRTQEIAIRMALGAQRNHIARIVFSSGTRLALMGCGLGVLASIATAHLVRSFLFDVSPTDPWILAGSIVLMVAVALCASAYPAFRAASCDPVDALRSIQ